MKKSMKHRGLIALMVGILALTGCQSPQVQPESTQTAPIENTGTSTNSEVDSKDEINKEINKDVKIDKRDSITSNGMVASAHPLASKVGVEVLEKGGNAVDAAVAVGFALGVLEPNASGIGGGGFMMVRSAETGETTFIDFREMLPADASIEKYSIDENGKVLYMENVIGPKSAAVPGEVAGLLYALENYGSLDRVDIMAPAIQFAQEGFVVSETLSGIAQGKFDLILGNDAASKVFTTDGLPLMAGDQLVQADLAKTLKKISSEGADGFYKGEIAGQIINEVQSLGGYMTLEDLENYSVKLRTPVKGTYRDYEIISAPPSSSGGTHVIELLNIMENFDVASWQPESAQSIHMWAEAMKLVYDDRNTFMGDTDFISVPLEGLQSKDYAKERAGLIDPEQASEDLEGTDPWKYESGSTTHYSIIDKAGNMVAVTKTINHFFGSGIVVPGTGILLNDEIADFSFDPESPNFIEGGKRPLSSMSPTLIMKDNKSYATIGTPGGKRIISTMAWVISRMIDYDMTVQEAIVAPRISQYEEGALKLEGSITQEVANQLVEMGHEVVLKKENDLYFGGVQGVVILENGTLHGGADPRRDGLAVGY